MMRGIDVLIIGSDHRLIIDTSLFESELLASRRFRYYGSEEFFNSGSRRKELQRILQDPRWTNPPPWLRPFRNLLAISKSTNTMILAFGSEVPDKRDERLAKHILEERRDRASSASGGVTGTTLLSMGAHHSARNPLLSQRLTTTRRLLEHAGLRVMSAYLASNRVLRAKFRADEVYDVREDRNEKIYPLLDFIPDTVSTAVVPLINGSPFDELTAFQTRASIGKNFEFAVLRRAMIGPV
jgi:hypothetical protein